MKHHKLIATLCLIVLTGLITAQALRASSMTQTPMESILAEEDPNDPNLPEGDELSAWPYASDPNEPNEPECPEEGGE